MISFYFYLQVAIKIINKRNLGVNNLQKTYREIEVLKKVRHPNIIRLYQVSHFIHPILLTFRFSLHFYSITISKP